MGYGISILNNIRANGSPEYQERIPEATRKNIAEIGNAMQTYTVVFNEYKTALIHKIGKTLIEQKLFKNKLARFKSGAILDQKDVEEIFINMAKGATPYDPDGKNPLGRRTDDNVKVVYHRMNRQDTYEFTIGDLDFLRAFKSEATLDSFIAGLINSVYSRANHDEWVIMKDLIASYDGFFDYQVEAITAETAEKGAKNFVKTVRKAVQDASFASTSYNKQGVMTWTDPSNLVLLVNKDVLAEIDVEVLAKAFNMGKTDIETAIVVMDNFGDLADTYGILVDKDWFKVFDTLSTMTSQYNAQGMFTNYFLHVHQIISASPFKTAIRLTTATVSA